MKRRCVAIELVILKVQTDVTALTALETQISALNSKKIVLNVDTSGLEKLTNAQARAISSSNNLAIAQEKTKQITEQRLTSESKLATQMEKTATAEEQARTANTKLSTEVQKAVTQQEKQNTAMAQTALQSEKTATAVANLAVQQEKAAAAAQSASSVLGTSGTYNATPMQQRIEDMVGLSSATKSAAESAATFQSAWASGGATPAYISQLGNQIGIVSTDFSSGASSVKKYINSLDGMFTASVKATGQTSQLGATFQTFSAAVKNTDGTLSTYKYAVNTATGQVYQLNKGVVEAGKSFDKTGDTILGAWKKMLLWSAAGTLIYAPIHAFQEALQTLKDVDTQLTDIKRVTGDSTEQINQMGATAYEAASKYGATADAYLASVADFARAGYGDTAEALAELAAKTQIAGNVTSDTADQFLIAVDAAYKYQGNVQKLGEVIDGVTKLDSKWATSTQKISEGLGVVSSVAAVAHVPINELSAAIGTITAVTQKTGTNAAYALRALFLNILKDTKTEISDGVTWTVDEINDLQDVLKKYAPDAVKAAAATGGLIDPMKAIGGLSQAMKDGLLSEQQLMAMTTKLGGKLRTDQLLALIENWDNMYKPMLADFESGTGTADKMVQTALESWDAKVKILKNTWTEFVSNLVNTDWIKDGIDSVNKFVKALDSSSGHAAIAVAAVILATDLASTGFKKLAVTAAGQYIEAIFAAIAGTEGATAALATMTTTMLANPLFWVTAGGLAIWGIITAVDKFSDSVKNANKQIEATNSKISDVQSKIDELEANGGSIKIIDAYKLKLKSLNDQMDQLNQHKFDLEFGENVGGNVVYDANLDQKVTTKVQNKVQSLIETLADLQKQQDAISSSDSNAIEKYDDLQKQIDDTNGSLQDYYIDMVTAKENGLQFSDSQAAIYLQLVKLYGSEEDVAQATKDMEAQHISAQAATLGNSNAVVNLVSNLSAEASQAGITKTAMEQLIAKSIAFSNTTLDVRQKLSALRQLAAMAGVTSALISSATSSEAMNSSIHHATNKGVSMADAQSQYIDKVYNELFGSLDETAASNTASTSGTQKAASSGSSGSSSKKSSSSKSTEDKKLTALKNVVELRKSELALLQEQDAPVDQQIAKMKQIQAALHNEANYLRNTKGSQSDINALSKEYLEYSKSIQELVKQQKEDRVSLLKSELELMQSRGDSTDSQIAKMKQIQAALHNEANYLRSIGADQTDINALSKEYLDISNDINDLLLDRADKVVDKLDDAENAALAPLDAQLQVLEDQNTARDNANTLAEKQLAIQEKQLAVDKAKIALDNAQKERTVRYFNAASGQWEWMADAKTVQSAKDALDDAQKNLVDAENDLADYYSDQAYEEAKATIEKQQENIKSAYEAFKNSWDDAKDAVDSGTMTISEAIGTMAGTIIDVANKYSVDLSAALGGVVSALGGASAITTSASGAKISYDSGTDYSAIMLTTTDPAVYAAAEAARDAKRASGDYSNVRSNAEIAAASKLYGKGTYDSGGIADGKGLLAKATDRPESVLDPDLTAKLLSPTSNEVFRRNIERIGGLFGNSNAMSAIERPITNNSSSDSHNMSYNFNGVPMPSGAENMTLKQIAQSFKTLGLYPS